MIAVLLSLVVTDVLPFRAHVLPRVIMLYTLAKKKKGTQSVACNPWYRCATWRRFARTSSLSLRPTSPFASYRPLGRAVPASGPRPAARLRAREIRSTPRLYRRLSSSRFPARFRQPSSRFAVLRILRYLERPQGRGAHGSYIVAIGPIDSYPAYPTHPSSDQPISSATTHTCTCVVTRIRKRIYRDTFGGWRMVRRSVGTGSLYSLDTSHALAISRHILRITSRLW